MIKLAKNTYIERRVLLITYLSILILINQNINIINYIIFYY